jgi:predicted phosphodiesterase
MGNADAELLAPIVAEPEADEDARKILEMSRWGARQLDEGDHAFIASFRPTVEIALANDRRLLCCHGSPRSYDDRIAATTPDDALDGLLAGHDAVANASGHTHIHLLRAFQGRKIVNSGSV